MIILKSKTYKHLVSEITRLTLAVNTERRNKETLRNGYEKQLAEKDRLIAQLTAANKS